MTDQSDQTPANRHQDTDVMNKNCSPKEIDAVKSFMSVFANVTKNYPLYPKEHAISENLLKRFEKSLAVFFQTSPTLKLNIEKERICFKGIEVYRLNEKENYLVTPFFRDGIIWIEFNEGVQNTELSCLLQILNKYRTLKDESEGDLATALWKQNFPHISHEAIDVYWETEPKLDFSHFNVAQDSSEEIQTPATSGGPGLGQDEQAEAEAEDVESPSTVSISKRDDMQGLIQISAREKEQIQKMITEDEKRNRTEDVMDVLLILLEDQNESEAFSDILEVLVQEFDTILKYDEFRLALKLFNHLEKISKLQPGSKSWQAPLLDKFFETVSKPEFLSGLNNQVPKLKPEDRSQIQTLKQVLIMLHPRAVLTIGPLMSGELSTEVRSLLMEVVTVLSRQDIGPLSELLKYPDEILIQQLVIIFGHLNNKLSHNSLLNLARHTSPHVRMEALKQLLKPDGNVQQSFFFMIEDSSDIIRREILNRLAVERSRESENLLLKYLREKEYNISDRDHILGCYSALGKCGSFRSVAYLKAALKEQPWIDVFSLRQNLHRLGAATALAELGTSETDEILKQAARSFFPQIRRAARSVFLENES